MKVVHTNKTCLVWNNHDPAIMDEVSFKNEEKDGHGDATTEKILEPLLHSCTPADLQPTTLERVLANRLPPPRRDSFKAVALPCHIKVVHLALKVVALTVCLALMVVFII
eukprot:CAMPEP_0183337236 /NCGR_PEP_ID=MMETSP0164_2-20130417/4963_1 /TAXON_ID=221442 /ORGANISM="Coccolithus pelagicus ssp braarudi, Strain PLY182g" /LENGTH=109 /DNA_ID=CAMNT_0025506903 /DNA_START=236 /DNA_END=565 /DNA_ORIENTATION=-